MGLAPFCWRFVLAAEAWSFRAQAVVDSLGPLRLSNDGVVASRCVLILRTIERFFRRTQLSPHPALPNRANAPKKAWGRGNEAPVGNG